MKTSTSTYASARANPNFAYLLSKPSIGHITSYEIYRSTANPELRKWVQRRVSECRGKVSEEEYVRWAIREFRTLESAKAAIMPVEVDEGLLKQTMAQAPVIGAKPTSTADDVKYFMFDKNLGIRVWVDNPADPYGNCCFDFINDKRVEIAKPAGLKVHALDGPLPGAEMYPFGEHLQHGMGIPAPGVTHPTWSTYLLLRGTTVRFRWNGEPLLHDVIVKMPMFLKGEGGRPPPLILS